MIANTSSYLLNQNVKLESTEERSSNSGNEEIENPLNENLDFGARLQLLAKSGKLSTSKISVKTKFDKKATDILKTWLIKNIDHPYPSEDVKDKLCAQTGLSRKQVQNWFINTRKRYVQPLKKKLDDQNETDGVNSTSNNDEKNVETEIDDVTSNGSGNQSNKTEETKAPTVRLADNDNLQALSAIYSASKVAQVRNTMATIQSWNMPNLNTQLPQVSASILPHKMDSGFNYPVNPYMNSGLSNNFMGMESHIFNKNYALAQQSMNNNLNFAKVMNPAPQQYRGGFVSQPCVDTSLINESLRKTIQTMREERLQKIQSFALMNQINNERFVNRPQRQDLEAYLHQVVKKLHI